MEKLEREMKSTKMLEKQRTVRLGFVRPNFEKVDLGDRAACPVSYSSHERSTWHEGSVKIKREELGIGTVGKVGG